ncbi:hypothetical protein ACS3SW_16855 [Roseobacteraceae bacterium S113]
MGVILWVFVAASAAQSQDITWQSYIGPVRDVVVGLNGEVAVIDTAGNVSRRDANGRFEPQPLGFLAQEAVAIDIAASGELWVLGAGGELWRLGGAGLGAARLVAEGIGAFGLAPGGEIVAATSQGDLGVFDRDLPEWEALPGRARAIVASDDGIFWRLSEEGEISLFRDDAWIGIEGRAADIWVRGGAVFIVDEAGTILVWDPEVGTWQPAAPGETSIAVAAGDGALWHIDTAGLLWAAGADSEPETEEPGENGGIEPSIPGVSGSGGTDPNRVPDTSSYIFTRLPDARRLDDLAIGIDGSVWGLSDSGAIFRWSNTTQRFRRFPGRLRSIAIKQDGLPIAVGTRAHLVEHDGQGWRTRPTDRSLNAVSLGLGDRLFVEDRRGQILVRPDPSTGPYFPMPIQARGPAGAQDGGVWVIGRGNQLVFCSEAGACAPKSLIAKDVAVGPGGTVFAIDLNGNLFRYLPDIDRFNIIRRGNTERVAVGPNDRPWILTTGGRVLYSAWFDRDESGDIALEERTRATQGVTQTPDGNVGDGGSDPEDGGGGGVVVTPGLVFTSVTIPRSAPSYSSLGPSMSDLSSGANDLVMAVGYDNVFTGDDTPCFDLSGQNWIFDRSLGAFAEMDWLHDITLTLGLAAFAPPNGVDSDPPPATGAIAHGGFFGLWERDCSIQELLTYSSFVFDDPLFQDTRDFSEAVLFTEGMLDVPLDMDIAADGFVANTNRERHLEVFSPNASDDVREFDELEFARVGMGQNEEDIWVIDNTGQVFQFDNSGGPDTENWIQRGITSDDRAQDVGVGFDGSVFIINMAGVLKRWDAALGQFTRTSRAGVTRVAVSSDGKPIVANFPNEEVVYFAR